MVQDDHVTAARAVYEASAADYVAFVGTEISAKTEAAVDRSMLTAFAELVDRGQGSRVADVGCGPGRVAAFLAARGLDVLGVDVSPAMIAVARSAHPGITFEEGSLHELPVGDGSLAGVVGWYSIIYTPPDQLDEVFAELQRVLDPNDGYLLLAFQAGHGDAVHREDAHGSALALTSYRHQPADVTRRLGDAALEVHATVVREPELAHESTPQAFVIARTHRR